MKHLSIASFLTVLAISGFLCTGCNPREDSPSSTPSLSPSPQPTTTDKPLEWGVDFDAVPSTKEYHKIQDLFEQNPDTYFFELRDGIEIVARGLTRDMTGFTVYFLPDQQIFYIQKDPAVSSSLTVYGPFQGDPRERLTLPPVVDDPWVKSNGDISSRGS